MPNLFTVCCAQKLLEDLEDASNEFMISDEDLVRYVIGSSFILLDKDEADERISKAKEDTEGQINGYNDELKAIRQQMAALKATLYGKFGTSINLEE
jgi:prefoldin subunit 4